MYRTIIHTLHNDLMPIVFTAITPHPPLLIPSIGKDNIKKFRKTIKAFRKLEQDLYASQPEVIIIFSPHGNNLANAFTVNYSPEFQGGFDDFGDFSTKITLKGELATAQAIRSHAENLKHLPIILASPADIDYGVSVPLYYLLPHLKNISVLPINPSGLDMETHRSFGRYLRRQLHKLNKRFALIASGDLSHRLSKDAPGGYSRREVMFNRKIVEIIRDKNVSELMKLDIQHVQQSSICIHRVLTILFCIIDDMSYSVEFISYENPFGVGYLCAEMIYQ